MKISLLIIILILIFACGACLAQNHKARYISLAPSTTEILFALGLDEEIVGVSTYCNYPLKVKSKEKIGEFSNVNIEKIISLRPDYIFCTGLEQEMIIRELRRLNLKVNVSDPTNMKELLHSIREIGRITSKNKEAESLVKDMEGQIEEVTSQVKLIPMKKRPKVFIELWHDPLTTAGKDSFVDELITLAGGINIAYDTKRPFSIFSLEEVIKRNPDCIIITYMDKERPIKLIEKRFGWSQIHAVKNNCVYNDIHPDLLLRPGPRVVKGLKEVYKRLYP
jgi:iron complex transport system substrate-binding protein